MTPNELFDLSDRVAIITGGAGGIGTVYARALCEAGASVVLADLNLDAAEAAAAALTADGHAASGTAVDVRSTASAEAMAAHAAAVFGGVDILVNNAAIMTDLPPYGLSDIPDDQWDRVMNVNFRGPLLCTQAAIPHMQARGG
ncbi:MAG: SDR family NAD(P)-dependent oxidoreductase, partial [Acidimicrobiales bacterium]|nr:SDR family NAD(P)-dependent oxidoreductase [Acidimicrobiales bacterium]